MVERETFIAMMSGVRSLVDSRMHSQVAEIISLCEKYRYLADKFTFDKDEELDKEVNRILVQLTDMVLAEMDARITDLAGEEDDGDTLLLYAKRELGGMDAVKRMDSYGTHLKYIVEGWLAIGFYTHMKQGDILSSIFSHLSDPEATKQWREAYKKGIYDSKIISEGGYAYGQGVLRSPLEGMTITGQGMLNDAYQMGMVEGYKRTEAIGYKVHRGSGYDCPYCDSLCVGIHPLDEMVLPAHPRCMCYTTPVFLGDQTI